MNAALIVAGALGVLAAGIHGGAGEALVVRKLSPETLSPSAFGGPRMTMAMIHVTWHMTTIAFLAIGVALLLSGTVVDGDAATALGLLGAAVFTAFAALAAGLGAYYQRSARSLFRHPAPAVLTLTAALAWWGAV